MSSSASALFPVLRRAAAGAVLLLCASVPARAAGAGDLLRVVLTPAYLDHRICNDIGFLHINLLNALKRGSGSLRMPAFTDAQIREIGAGYDAINARACAALQPFKQDLAAWERSLANAKSMRLEDRAWDAFLADPVARRWSAIAAQLRIELEALHSVMRVQHGLRRDIYNPGNKDLPASDDAALRKLEQEVRLVSLTDEEATMRMVLATMPDRAAMRAMLPARYDLDSLARLEAKTRQLGVQVLARHPVRFGRLFKDLVRADAAGIQDKELAVKMNSVAHEAERDADALASRLRRDMAGSR